MDVLMVYALFATFTPLFLWIEYRKMAIIQLPLIVGMWSFLIIEIGALTVHPIIYGLSLSLLVINILYAHAGLVVGLVNDSKMRGKLDDMSKAVSRTS
ncbi:spore morphogenesis/germination protein YwcE [Pontibacillus sp. HMF3514]|uniref:spore morphogenesis/germination protein YwcE n=1 Tax=Pontibacillus sp. HMF3514 TaxID=2692425 RepID=UPI0013203504|nr:spore morphogenesis/germination protein YwcE [Pontibacillus sp. HMF3514]QHE52021.1 hypothetical protein GS400_08260 [Pontibacillus sp. HMF3514]